MRVAFLITTYNRSASCKRVVSIIKGLGDVYIVDDCSDQDYTWAQKYNYTRRTQNGGKRGYWATVTALWQMVRPHKYDYYIMLPDDFIPEPNFLRKSIGTWDSIRNSNKICLNLYADKGRKGKICWTRFAPIIHPEAAHTQWVDMCFLAKRKFFDVLNWGIPSLALNWEKRPDLSSGVGAWISHELHNGGYSLWQTHTSMFRSNQECSVMNGDRKKEDVSIHDSISGVITAQIASLPEREQMLEKTIASLRPQVDRIFVGLNNYDHTPLFLKKGEYIHLDNSTGDAAKFYNVEDVRGYFFCCDDDLIYPANYVQYMIGGLHKHNAITTLHGKRYPRPFIDYPGCEARVQCLTEAWYDMDIDMPGTGVTCFHTDMIKVRYDDFKIRNMADIWFTGLAKKQGVKIVALAHPADYLQYQNPDYVIFTEEKQKNWKIQNRLLAEIFNDNI